MQTSVLKSQLNIRPLLLLTTLFFTVFSSLPKASAAGVDVLYIGDSHSYGCFGQNLDSSIRRLSPAPGRPDQHLTALSSATCGSSSSSWLKPNGNDTQCGFRYCERGGNCRATNVGHSPSLASLLTLSSQPPLLTPSTVIVELGSNMLKANIDKTMADVREIILDIRSHGSSCIWVGPPQPALFFQPKAAYEHFNQVLNSVVTGGNCRFVDSNTKTSRGKLNDPIGLHYSCADATRWSQLVFDEISPDILTAAKARSAEF